MIDREPLRQLLYGTHCHLHTLHALEGLAPELAGKLLPSCPHSIFQILHHMLYWQDHALARMRGENPPDPEHAAEGWDFPAAPEDDSDWEATVASFAESLRAIEGMVADPDYDLTRVVGKTAEHTALQQVFMVQGHNSHHLGQIVILRRQLDAWPPPRGGDTW